MKCWFALVLAVVGSAGVAAQNCTTRQCGKFQQCKVYEGKEEYCADVCVPERCSGDEKCVLQTVECFRAPCPKIANCVSKTINPTRQPNNTNPTPTLTHGPGPAPITLTPSCKSSTCLKWQKCMMYEHQAYCYDTCDSGRCGDNEICTFKQVQCFKAPCFPIVECLPKSKAPTIIPTATATLPPKTIVPNTSATVPTQLPPTQKPPQCKVTCPVGQECTVYEGKPYCYDICTPDRCGPLKLCKLVQVQCFKAPCFPVAECLALPKQ